MIILSFKNGLNFDFINLKLYIEFLNITTLKNEYIGLPAKLLDQNDFMHATGPNVQVLQKESTGFHCISKPYSLSYPLYSIGGNRKASWQCKQRPIFMPFISAKSQIKVLIRNIMQLTGCEYANCMLNEICREGNVLT